MTTTHRKTEQKITAVRAYYAGMDEYQACEFAGYVEPHSAKTKVFRRNPDGTFADSTVEREYRHLTDNRTLPRCGQ